MGGWILDLNQIRHNPALPTTENQIGHWHCKYRFLSKVNLHLHAWQKRSNYELGVSWIFITAKFHFSFDRRQWAERTPSTFNSFTLNSSGRKWHRPNLFRRHSLMRILTERVPCSGSWLWSRWCPGEDERATDSAQLGVMSVIKAAPDNTRYEELLLLG